MANKNHRTLLQIAREEEELLELKFKKASFPGVFTGDLPRNIFSKKIGKYFVYYGEPAGNTWELCIDLPDGDIHIIKTFKNMRAMLQSNVKSILKL